VGTENSCKVPENDKKGEKLSKNRSKKLLAKPKNHSNNPKQVPSRPKMRNPKLK
jgi:hypothetical protein